MGPLGSLGSTPEGTPRGPRPIGSQRPPPQERRAGLRSVLPNLTREGIRLPGPADQLRPGEVGRKGAEGSQRPSRTWERRTSAALHGLASCAGSSPPGAKLLTRPGAQWPRFSQQSSRGVNGLAQRWEEGTVLNTACLRARPPPLLWPYLLTNSGVLSAKHPPLRASLRLHRNNSESA